jgi:energy-coupling factor transport system ATP-binding protein
VTSSPPVVAVERVSCRYPGSDTPALHDVSFELRRGEMTLIVGPSGCGKSTLALCLAGLIPHFIDCEMDGVVRICGTATADAKPHDIARSAGILFQNPDAQLCNLYVRNEIAFGCENLLLPQDEIRERVARYAALLDVAHLQDGLCSELSGGQKQRVTLASVLAMEPSLLVLDEPTSNLDSASTEVLLECIRRLRREKDITILLIEHKIDSIVHEVDRVMVMQDGRIAALDGPREIYAELGRDMLARTGAWTPQVVEFALKFEDRHRITLPSLPLTATEAATIVSDLGYRRRWVPRRPCRRNHADKPLFELRGLSYRYESGAHALRDASLEIREGDAVALIGHNGSGKTTLGKLLLRFIAPSSGEILYAGRSLAGIDYRIFATEVGYLFQNMDSCFTKAKVIDEIEHSLRLIGHPEATRSARADEILARFGLAALRDHDPLSLSAGERRILSFALYAPFKLRAIVLDEPTIGVDYKGTLRLLELIADLRRAGAAILVITHDARVIAATDRVVGLRAGAIVCDSTPRELFTRPELREFAALVEPPVATLSRQIPALDGDEIALTPEELCGMLAGDAVTL